LKTPFAHKIEQRLLSNTDVSSEPLPKEIIEKTAKNITTQKVTAKRRHFFSSDCRQQGSHLADTTNLVLAFQQNHHETGHISF